MSEIIADSENPIADEYSKKNPHPGRRVRRHVAKEIKKLKKILAVVKNPTLQDAYQELYPNASKRTANVNAGKLATPEVFEGIKKLLEAETVIHANKELLEKVLFTVVSRWLGNEERTGDMIAAVRELTKLVPEFKDKLPDQAIKDADEKELDRRLRSFGFDPTVLPSKN